MLDVFMLIPDQALKEDNRISTCSYEFQTFFELNDSG